MRFICAEEPPPPKTLNIGERAVKDESLIVNKVNHGIQNVCVWLLRRPGDLFSVDDSNQAEQPKRVMALTAGNFSPHIAILRTPQTLAIRNADSWGYNIMADGQRNNRPFSELLKPGDSIEKRFEFKEDYPVRLTSTIHPWIAGSILALDQPFGAITDDDGRLTINDIPAGKWPFVIWHERCGSVKELSRAGQPLELPDGLMWYTINPGANDIGEFALSPRQLRLR